VPPGDRWASVAVQASANVRHLRYRFQTVSDLPEFAAFVLLEDEAGRKALRRYCRSYAETARDAGTGFVLEAPTWRANPDWAAKLGRTPRHWMRSTSRPIDRMADIRRELETSRAPFVVSGCIGPRRDAYRPSELMTPDEAERYHAIQIGTLSRTEADPVTAITMTHSAEAIGVTRAAVEAQLPVVISFTGETDGTLPSGEALGAAIRAVDDATASGPACVHDVVNAACAPEQVDVDPIADVLADMAQPPVTPRWLRLRMPSPVLWLSTTVPTVTTAPIAISSSVRWEPRKPAPPKDDRVCVGEVALPAVNPTMIATPRSVPSSRSPR
jgi:S-methylmethionine-dependent homocysteine/selenocysteine methylase